MVIVQRRAATRWRDGTALLGRFRSPIKTPDDLWAEARELWRAEELGRGLPTVVGNATWGTVGLLARGSTDVLVADWHRRVQAGQILIPEGVLPLSKSGDLQMDWPWRLEDGKAADCDVILAAVNVQNQKMPAAREIADAWKLRGHASYFYENRDAGIRTVQDEGIRRRLQATGRLKKQLMEID